MYVQREKHEQNKSSFKQLGPKCWPDMMATLKRICQLVFVRTEVCVLTYILVIIIYTYHIGTTNSSCRSKVPVSLKRKPLRRSKKKPICLICLRCRMNTSCIWGLSYASKIISQPTWSFVGKPQGISSLSISTISTASAAIVSIPTALLASRPQPNALNKRHGGTSQCRIIE